MLGGKRQRWGLRILLCMAALAAGASLERHYDLSPLRKIARQFVESPRHSETGSNRASPGAQPPSAESTSGSPKNAASGRPTNATGNPGDRVLNSPGSTTAAAQPPDPGGARFRDGMVITGSTPHRMILFTFDDGPHHVYTKQVLDHLDHFGLKAVFFVTASRFDLPKRRRHRQHRAVLKEIVRRGHIVANHTVTHRQLPLLTDEEVRFELLRAESLIAGVTGERPWLLRPPGGARSDRIDHLVASRGYTSVLWNLGAGDFQVRTPEDVVRTWRRVFERREREHGDRGGIILLHDTHPWTAAAVPMIVSELRERNCELLANGEELYDVVDDLQFFFARRDTSAPTKQAPAAVIPPGVLALRQARIRAETEARCGAMASR